MWLRWGWLGRGRFLPVVRSLGEAAAHTNREFIYCMLQCAKGNQSKEWIKKIYLNLPLRSVLAVKESTLVFLRGVGPHPKDRPVHVNGIDITVAVVAVGNPACLIKGLDQQFYWLLTLRLLLCPWCLSRHHSFFVLHLLLGGVRTRRNF